MTPARGPVSDSARKALARFDEDNAKRGAGLQQPRRNQRAAGAAANDCNRLVQISSPLSRLPLRGGAERADASIFKRSSSIRIPMFAVVDLSVGKNGVVRFSLRPVPIRQGDALAGYGVHSPLEEKNQQAVPGQKTWARVRRPWGVLVIFDGATQRQKVPARKLIVIADTGIKGRPRLLHLEDSLDQFTLVRSAEPGDVAANQQRSGTGRGIGRIRERTPRRDRQRRRGNNGSSGHRQEAPTSQRQSHRAFTVRLNDSSGFIGIR